jgi:Protein of unknown function (DUF935)
LATQWPIKQSTKKSLQHRINRTFQYEVRMEMDAFKSAIKQAINPLRYDRRMLYGFYREIEMDDEVHTQRRVATVTVRRAPFVVHKGDQLPSDYEASEPNPTNDPLTRLFKTTWFHDLLAVCIETELWGHSLIEFIDQRNEEGEFTAFKVLPRDHVRPEYGDVLLNVSDIEGVPFRDEIGTTFPLVLEMGRADDLGIYKTIAVPALRKRYADTDWSMFSERFGSPFLTIKTNTDRQAELDKKEAMARAFGSNGWAILDEGDEVETIFSNHNGMAHKTFEDRIKSSNEAIAKIINGQTSSSSEKSHVGAAQVHERLLDDFAYDRLCQIQYWINNNLIPMLTTQGYALEGAKFQFLELLPKKPIQPDTPETPANGGRKDGGRKTADGGRKTVSKKALSLNSPERATSLARGNALRMDDVLDDDPMTTGHAPLQSNIQWKFSEYYQPFFHPKDCDCPSCQIGQ